MNPPQPLRSPVLEDLIEQIRIPDPKIARMFRRCLLNPLETTVILTDEETFIITGDIPAMWLRDSSAQVNPYIPYCKEDQVLQRVIRGLIRRQAFYINLDPYANAFNREPNAQGHQSDETEMNPWIWERKYEVDSLCYPLRLAYRYWKATGDSSIFDQQWLSAVTKILQVWRVEQDHRRSSYRFVRRNAPPSDTLPNEGRGNPVIPTGMTWSGFRPSDDACLYGYLIPSEMFAVVVLNYLQEVLHVVYRDPVLVAECQNLQFEIDRGIHSYGIVEHPEFGEIYAYEVDGQGGVNFMDDANVPSLLSIPYLSYTSKEDPLYQRTRRFVLSKANPYYSEGKYARGVGSPHTFEGSVWPIAIIMQGLTAQDRAEAEDCLRMLRDTDADTELMHEAFDPDNPRRFTRPWFAWANSLFAELVLTLYLE